MTRTNEKISKSTGKKSYALSIKNDADRRNPRHGLASEYLFEVLREKQFYKEMTWLCINLRKEYKKEIIPLIKRKIKDIKDIKDGNEEIYYNHAAIKERQRKIDDLKLIYKCRSKIFELINTISLGLKTKNSIFLIFFQKNVYNKIIIPSHCIEKPINSKTMRGNRTNTIVAFADVFIPYSGLDLVEIKVDDHGYKKFDITLKTNISRYWRNTNKEDYKYFYWDKWNNSTLGEVKIAKQESEEVLQQINFYHELISPTRTYICLDYQDTQLLNLIKDSTIQVNCLGSKFEEFCNNRPIQELKEI